MAKYAYLESKGIKSYIPPHGTYKGGPEGFDYIKSKDHYICPNGAIVPFKKVFKDYRTQTLKKEYRISSKVCKECPLASSCLGKTAKEKKFSVTYYRDEYERNNARLATGKGKAMKGKRQSTVEPFFGTLTQFMGLRKINTIGLVQANKVMHMSAMAYNLKKYLKYITKTVKSGAKTKHVCFLHLKSIIWLRISFLVPLESHKQTGGSKNKSPLERRL